MCSKKLARELMCVPEDLHQLFIAVREMNTLVCEVCFSEELRKHPVLGEEWRFEWYLEMAKLAKKQGWITRDPPANRTNWFFKEFQVVGPECIGTSDNGT